ncbi:MAG: hypothetical protein ACFFD4_09770 [Candidatus Odinarchaeota archaeon]
MPYRCDGMPPRRLYPLNRLVKIYIKVAIPMTFYPDSFYSKSHSSQSREK